MAASHKMLPVGTLLASQSLTGQMGAVALLELQSFAQAVSAQRAFSVLPSATRTTATINHVASSSGIHHKNTSTDSLQWPQRNLTVQPHA
jgi:hypothetical protein